MASVTVSGPFFDGRDHAILDVMCEAIADEVGTAAEGLVLARTAASFKTRTPYYETKVGSHDAGIHARDVDDGGVIYGPWLEGVGSRNFPVTRFKGYSMYRRATRELNEGVAEAIANRVAERYIRRM